MKGAFADEYWKAAVTEIESLEGLAAWDIIKIAQDCRHFLFRLVNNNQNVFQEKKPEMLDLSKGKTKAARVKKT